VSWIDREPKAIEHGSGLRPDELRRLFGGRGPGEPPLGQSLPAALTAGPRLVDLLEWAREANPGVAIEVLPRRIALLVRTERGEFVEDRFSDEDWIDVFRRVGLLGRS
jgi:hypothetical protein